MHKAVLELYKSKEECCGCGVCSATCPQNAIEMISDNHKMLYPSIDASKCVQCKLCLKVCPIKNITKQSIE